MKPSTLCHQIISLFFDAMIFFTERPTEVSAKTVGTLWTGYEKPGEVISSSMSSFHVTSLLACAASCVRDYTNGQCANFSFEDEGKVCHFDPKYMKVTTSIGTTLIHYVTDLVPEVKEIVSEGIITEGITTENIVTEGKITKGIITEEIVTQEIITEGIVTERIITEGIITERIVTEGIETEETKTEEIVTETNVTQGIITEGIVTEEIVTEGIVTEEIVTEETVTERVVTEENVTQWIITEGIVTQEIATKEIITEEIVTERVVTEENVTQWIITEGIVTQEIVTQEVVTQEIVTKEIVTEQIATPSCSDQYFAVSYNDTRVLLCLNGEDWQKSNSACSNMQGKVQLLRIHTKEFMDTMSYIFNEFKAAKNQWYWVDARDTQGNGSYVWGDGTAVNDSFIDGWSGECMYLNSYTMRLAGKPCYDYLSYICEVELP